MALNPLAVAVTLWILVSLPESDPVLWEVFLVFLFSPIASFKLELKLNAPAEPLIFPAEKALPRPEATEESLSGFSASLPEPLPPYLAEAEAAT